MLLLLLLLCCGGVGSGAKLSVTRAPCGAYLPEKLLLLPSRCRPAAVVAAVGIVLRAQADLTPGLLLLFSTYDVNAEAGLRAPRPSSGSLSSRRGPLHPRANDMILPRR